jgi:hypothetical protein
MLASVGKDSSTSGLERHVLGRGNNARDLGDLAHGMQMHTSGTGIPNANHAATMPHRTYRDADDREWSVWDIHPEDVERQLRGAPPRGHAPVADAPTRSRMAVSPDFMLGWLCFEAMGAKRRLTPIPPGWDALTDAELAELCARAVSVPERRVKVQGARSAPPPG